MSWAAILKREPTLKKKIWRASKTGNFDELIENHSKAQLRRRANELVDEDAITEEKMKPHFDALGASKRDTTGKDSEEYKRPNKKEIEMYESFVSGNVDELPEYLNDGTGSAKRNKISRMITWDTKNGDKILKFVRDKPELYGYNTEGLTLELPPTFDRDKLGDLQYQLGNSLIVTLPPHLSIEQGKTLAGGTPSEPIERNFFARIYKAPKYKTEIVKNPIDIDPETFSDQFASEYLTMIITNLSGSIRGDFMPNLYSSETMPLKQKKKVQQMFFGADTAGGTSRMYPAMEFILDNEKLDLKTAFVKRTTKRTLQEKELGRRLHANEVDNAELNNLFGRMVDVKEGNYVGWAKFKEAVEDADLMDDYSKELKNTQVRQYTLAEPIRDAFVAMLDGKETEKQVTLLKGEFNHLFTKRNFKRQVRNMAKTKGLSYGKPETIKSALSRMEEKITGTVSVMDKDDIPILSFLFNEVDSDPMATFLSSSKTNYSSKGRLKDIRLASTQVLEFSDLVVVLIELDKKLLRTNRLEDALDEIHNPIDDVEDAETEFSELLLERFAPIRKALLLAIKKKMSEVVSEPILHNKKIVQPYDWIQSGGRTQ